MPAVLTIEISDEILQCLRRTGEQQGKTAEAVAAEYLSNVATEKEGPTVRRWVGMWASNVPDASLRHDEYLRQALHEELGESKHD